MKRLLFICLLLVAAWTLFAQTGLFGLYYGESYGAVKDSLENYEPAFDCIEEEGTRSVYVSYDNEYVDQIVCYFDKPNGSLVSWQVFYIEQPEEDIWDIAYDAAYDWHDEGDYDDDFEVYSWELGGGKMLLMGYNSDYWLVADYYNEAYPEISEVKYW